MKAPKPRRMWAVGTVASYPLEVYPTRVRALKAAYKYCSGEPTLDQLADLVFRCTVQVEPKRKARCGR